MDIRVRDLLSKIRSVKGAENSIIAGGAVRDVVLGYEPKDYDFFIPASGFREVYETLEKKGVKGLKRHPEAKEYKQSITQLQDVYQAEYEGLKVEFMKEAWDNNSDFPTRVLRSFDYGLCMIFYEGETLVRESEEFIKDRDNMQMTLHSLRRVSDLPKHIGRFNRINEKLGGKYTFNCPYMKFDKPKSEEEGVYVFDVAQIKEKTILFDRFGRNLNEVRWENPWGNGNPAAEIPLPPVRPVGDERIEGDRILRWDHQMWIDVGQVPPGRVNVIDNILPNGARQFRFELVPEVPRAAIRPEWPADDNF